MARIDELFHYLKQNKGSDLHLAAGLEPRIRVHGSLAAVAGWPVLSHFDLLDLLREIASDDQWAEYSGCGDLDFAYGLEGVARFRANYLRQENGCGAVFRIIPEKIVPLEELHLPKAIDTLAHLQQG
ncbi:MAG TPA: type IV pili twitching motility protein PilT, partial [Thermoanaerobaculia bacterium]